MPDAAEGSFGLHRLFVVARRLRRFFAIDASAQWNQYFTDKYQLNYGKVGPNSDQYCSICNPFQYATPILTDDVVRTAHLADTTDLYKDIENGTLPAVSFVKPSG
ncbi:MAG TPA: hypothetical protein VN976_08655 [Verrucomicrobiae bacterium]|nr:hypothetical protein [Verrucomicrobiae bacterium]